MDAPVYNARLLADKGRPDGDGRRPRC